jgi:uncharacterized Zn finger protein (UPF0148 family)
MASESDTAFHLIGSNTVGMTNTKCPECGATEFEMRNYEMMWHEGNIHCAQCGKFIRRFDAG